MRSLSIAICAVLAATLLASEARSETPHPAQSGLGSLSEADLAKLTDALRAEPQRPLKVRLQAALILGRVGGVGALPALTACLSEDADYPVRAACALALGNIGDVRAAEPLVAQLSDPEQLVYDESRTALLKLARPEALPYLIAGRERGSSRVRLALVEVVSLVNAPEAGLLLAELLGDPDERVRAQAEAVLRKMDVVAATELLMKGLEHPNYRVRAQSAKLLGERKQLQAADKLIELAGSPVEATEVMLAAREALHSLRAFFDVGRLSAQARSSSAERKERSRALLLLGAVGGPDALQACLDVLADPDESMRGAAAQALGQLGDPRALPALREAQARSENKRVSKVIGVSIRRIERSNSQ